MNQIKLQQIKCEPFIYINKKYEVEGWITEDRKFFFKIDKLDYVKVYKANASGKGELIYELYHNDSPYAYPIYTLEQAVKKLYDSGIDTKYILKINPTRIGKKTKIITIE